jgi:hypothetical protein
MTATSRFTCQPTPLGDDNGCLVVFIGLRRSLGANANGIFTRCELRTLEVPEPEDAAGVLSTISPDAVVLDMHHPGLKRLTERTRLLIQLLRARSREHRTTPIVCLSSVGVSRDLRNALVDLGAVLVHRHHQTHRQLSMLIRDLCGFPDRCCN